MFKTTLSTLGLVALTALPGLANPASLVIGEAFNKAQNLEVSGETDHFLDLSETGYTVLEARSSDHTEFRALAPSQAERDQLVLRWVKGSTAKSASLVLKVSGPLGTKSLRYRVTRVGKAPDNILTMYTTGPVKPLVATAPPVNKGVQQFPRLEVVHSGRENAPINKPVTLSVKPPKPSSPRSSFPVKVSDPSAKAPRPVQIRQSPKLVRRVAKVSTTGRILIDRSTLDNKALANYLIRGLHRARGLRQINRNHKLYWQAQSAARYLRRGASVEKALKYSHLPQKTYDDLLGHGGVSR